MILPRPVRAVLFDMDGLLCDTEVMIRDAMFAVAARQGHEFPLSLFQSMIGLPVAASDQRMIDHFGEDYGMDAFRAELRPLVDAACEAGIAIKTGVVELLDHLDAQRIPRAIVTSSSPRAVERHLGPSGVIPRFQAVIAAGAYAQGKPAPDPYLAGALALGVDPGDCLALEDSHNGVRSAAAAGCMTVMVPDLLQPTDEIHRLCVGIARDLHDVREMLEAQVALPTGRAEL